MCGRNILRMLLDKFQMIANCLEPAGTFGMYPICYWWVSGRYFQPEPAMYSRCFRWFPGPLAPSVVKVGMVFLRGWLILVWWWIKSLSHNACSSLCEPWPCQKGHERPLCKPMNATINSTPNHTKQTSRIPTKPPHFCFTIFPSNVIIISCNNISNNPQDSFQGPPFPSQHPLCPTHFH